MFAGIGEEEISAMLSCLGAKLCHYKKGEYVLRQGDRPGAIVILVKGSLHIQKDDYWGNRSILSQIAAGEMFGEAYAAPESGGLRNDVVAVEDSSVIFLTYTGSLPPVLPPAVFIRPWSRTCFFPYPRKTGNWCRSWGICPGALRGRN